MVIDFESISINIFTRSASIRGISIIPTKEAIDNVARSQLSKPVIEIQLDKIKVSGIGIMKAVRGNGVSVGKISLTEPLVTVYGNGNPFKGNGKDNDKSNIFSSDTVIESPVKEARLSKVEIEDAHICYLDLSRSDTIVETKRLNIELSDLWLHKPEEDTLSHVLDVGDIIIRLASHTMELPGDFYTLQTGALDIRYADGSISLDSLELIPAWPKGVFGKKFGKQTDRFHISAGNISISGLEFDSLLNKKIIVDELHLEGPNADICRDKRVARDMTIFPKLFQTAVAELPLLLEIEKITVSDGYLNYQDIPEGSNKAGGVIVGSLNLDITGVCNHKDSIKNGQAIMVDARAKLMDESSLQAFFDLPVGNHAEYFTFYGNLSSIPASSLNPLLAPLAFVEAKKGNINSTRFYAMAMNDTAVGRLDFQYQDMEVAVLKKKEVDGKEHQNKFYSFIARTAMHKNNPHVGKPVRIAKMSFVRDRNKGFFNYVWKTIQDGIIVTLTPGKKRLANDMEWPEFSSSWRKVLLNDWHALPKAKAKKK
jgi:hypothetical protein